MRARFTRAARRTIAARSPTRATVPARSFSSLFAFVSTIDEPIVSSTILESTSAFVPPAPPLLSRLALPDAPPPKN